MAPTEVLAEQHHLASRELLDGLTVPAGDSLLAERPVRVELLTNRTTAAERRQLGAALAARRGRHPRRHPRAALRRRRVPRPRCRGDRRAAPLRRRAARAAARQGSRARRARDDRDADPAHRGDARLRRPRQVRAARDAARPHADHDAGRRAEPARPGRARGTACARRSRPATRPTSCARSSRTRAGSRRSAATEEYERLQAEELAGLRLGLLHGQLRRRRRRR